MAYLKDDPKNDPQDEVQSNVLGQEQGSIQPSEQPQQEGGGQVTSQAQVSPQGNLRPGSGGTGSRQAGFVDVKNYVQKNKPQGARIAKKAQGGIDQKAQQIGQQVQARKSALKDVLDRNANQMRRDYDVASGMLTPGENTAAPTSEEIQSFQQTMKGQGQLQQAPDMERDLQRAELEARQLGNQQIAVPTLLRDTFGSQGRQYTSGQQRLDEMLLGGTGAASQIQDAAKAASQAQIGGISELRRRAVEDMAQQKIDRSNYATQLQGDIEAARSGVIDPVQAQLDAEIAERSRLLGEFNPEDTETAKRMGLLRNVFQSKLKGSELDQLMNSGSNSLVAKAWKNTLKSRGVDTSPYSSLADFRQQVTMTPEERELIGLSEDNTFFGGTEGKGRYWDLQNQYASDIARKLGDFSIDSDLEKQLTAQGISREALEANKDLNLANLSTPEQIARYNYIQQLAGNEDILAPESQEDYVSAEELQALLDKYK